jgi:ABC-type dipeptide/oligopeptide/nickel transport system permease component
VLWVNLGLASLVVALAIALISSRVPRLSAIGGVLTGLGLQVAGILVVTWFLVELGQGLATALPPPPEAEAAIWARISAPAFNSLLLIGVATLAGTCAGTATAGFVAWSRSRRLALVIGLASLVWIVPVFLIGLLAQDLQAWIYNVIGVNVTGGYAQFSLGQLVWGAAVLAIRPAAYAYRQAEILIADESKADYVRTALSKGLSWGAVVRRHIIRPAASGLAQTAASSIRLMFGSLPLVEFFFGYPGLGHLLLQSLGVASGTDTQPPDPTLAIASAVALALMLAVVDSAARVATQRLDPRLAEAEAA